MATSLSAGSRETGDFVRARYDDLGDFFKEKYDLSKKDENLVRIRKVLELMDKAFKKSAPEISSRAVAVSAYLFAEDLYTQKKTPLIPQFAKLYTKLLNEIDEDLKRLAAYRTPTNRLVLEEFQK